MKVGSGPTTSGLSYAVPDTVRREFQSWLIQPQPSFRPFESTPVGRLFKETLRVSLVGHQSKLQQAHKRLEFSRRLRPCCPPNLSVTELIRCSSQWGVCISRSLDIPMQWRSAVGSRVFARDSCTPVMTMNELVGLS